MSDNYLFICSDCQKHEFVLVSTSILPYRVAVLCTSCGNKVASLAEIPGAEEVVDKGCRTPNEDIEHYKPPY